MGSRQDSNYFRERNWSPWLGLVITSLCEINISFEIINGGNESVLSRRVCNCEFERGVSARSFDRNLLLSVSSPTSLCLWQIQWSVLWHVVCIRASENTMKPTNVTMKSNHFPGLKTPLLNVRKRTKTLTNEKYEKPRFMVFILPAIKCALP